MTEQDKHDIMRYLYTETVSGTCRRCKHAASLLNCSDRKQAESLLTDHCFDFVLANNFYQKTLRGWAPICLHEKKIGLENPNIDINWGRLL